MGGVDKLLTSVDVSEVATGVAHSVYGSFVVVVATWCYPDFSTVDVVESGVGSDRKILS